MAKGDPGREGDPRRSWRLWFWLQWAKVTVTIERLWPALMPLFALCVVFLVLAFFDIWSSLPYLVHLGGLALFALALVYLVWRGARHWSLASNRDGFERLERDAGVAHQPIRALDEDLAGEQHDPLTRSLWQRHRQRLLSRFESMQLVAPRSDVPKLDPWAIRALILLVLVVGVVEARGEFGERLVRAFTPTPAAARSVDHIRFGLWITPPAYTRITPISEEQTAQRDFLSVPSGSEALLQLHNMPLEAEAALKLTFNGEPIEVSRLDATSGEVRMVFEDVGLLEIAKSDGELLKSWSIDVEPDDVPQIKFVGVPVVTQRSTMEVGYEASDDHGIAELALVFAPATRPDEEELAPLGRPGDMPRQIQNSAFVDLTSHPLAGIEVVMRLEAKDAIGQVGRSESQTFVLPERVFTHPLARAVVTERKRLMAEPQAADEVRGRLNVLAQSRMAQELDIAVPLALATAASRVAEMRDAEDRRSVADLLWELALYIEDGTMALAERTLRELQEELQQALLEGADDAELEELMNQLQEAMDQFLEEMMRQAMEQAQRMPPNAQQPQPIDPSQMVSRDQLQEMLERARELMQSGAKEQAMEMLAELQRMLENLQAGMQPMEANPAEQALQDLQRMIELQQQLQDKSFQMQNGQQQQGEQGQQQGQRGQQQPGQQPGQQQGGGTGQAAGEQEGLRRALGELMRRLGEMGMDIPRALGQAELQMRGARDALQDGQPGQAIQPQGDATDFMRQGGQAMMEQLREQMAQQPGQGQQPVGAQRQGRDPLGRSVRNQGGADTQGAEVPEENDLGRARGVMEELHRRSRQLNRPPQELDYFDRLLDRF